MTKIVQEIGQDMEKAKHKVEDVLEKALGDVINPVVECTDVDGIVRRIDVNNVVERIDVNELLNRVDVNKQLARVDVNALMRRVDFDEVVERSNLSAIVAQSSGGVFTGLMDTMRVQIVDVDLFLYRIFQCNRKILPPAPGKVDTHSPYPDTKMEKAIAVQRHYCGFFSKALAIAIDWGLLLIIMALITIAVQLAYQRIDYLFIKSTQEEQEAAKVDEIWVTVITFICWYCYFWLAVGLPGQTVGMGIVGVRVAQINGNNDVPLGRAAIRAGVLFVTMFCWPVTMWVGIIRRDGRMPHDLVACTGMIYKWNANLASVREKALQRAQAEGEDKAELDP